MHACMHAHMHAHTRISIHTHAHTHMHAHMRAHAQMHVHIYIHTCKYIFIAFMDSSGCLTLPFLVARVLCDSLIFPLQDKLDEWKKTTIQLDKDHAKGN